MFDGEGNDIIYIMKRFIILFTLLLTLVGCKQEYVQPSGNISDMSGYKGLDSQQFVDLSIDDFLSLINEKDTAIVYFGRSDCHICNQLVPVINEVSLLKEMKLYYVDMNLSSNLENRDGIDEIRSFASDYFDSYESEYESFPIPCIIYIKKGKVLDVHIGTVSSNIKEEELTESQKARLKYNLSKEFDAIIE